MTERFWIAPLTPPLELRDCELCGKPGVDMYIQDLAPDSREYIRLVHATCLALYCEHHGITPPKSFVEYCITALGMRRTVADRIAAVEKALEDTVITKAEALESLKQDGKENEYDQAGGVDNPPRIRPGSDG